MAAGVCGGGVSRRGVGRSVGATVLARMVMNWCGIERMRLGNGHPGRRLQGIVDRNRFRESIETVVKPAWFGERINAAGDRARFREGIDATGVIYNAWDTGRGRRPKGFVGHPRLGQSVVKFTRPRRRYHARQRILVVGKLIQW